MTTETLPVREHIRSLVRNILASFGAILLASGIVHWQRDVVIGFLLEPLGTEAAPLQFLSPLDPLFFILKVDFTLGFLVSLPLVLFLIWRFVAPATKSNIGVGLFVVFTTSLLALTAGAYAYTLVVPIILSYMSSIVISGTTAAFTAHGYLNFLLTTTFLLVTIFQLPLAFIGAASLGLIKAKELAKRRRVIYLGAIVLTAVITPTTDVITLALISVPTIVVIELGIGGAWLVERAANRKAAQAEKETTAQSENN